LIWWQDTGFDGLAFAVGFLWLLVCGWLLKMAAANRSRASGTTAWPKLVLLAVPITLGLTFFLLARYYRTDSKQFGEVDHPYLQSLNQAAAGSQFGDHIITVAPYHYHLPMNRFKARVPIIGFAQIPEALPPTAESLLGYAFNEGAARVWLVTVGYQPAEAANGVEAWLARHAYKAGDQWLDRTRLVDYGLPQPGEAMTVDQMVGDTIELTSLTRPELALPGEIFPVEFRWQAMKPPLADYVVFLQLLAVDGQLAAQHDGLPQGGYLPTSHWPVDETIVDRHGLALPPVLSAGDYRLIAGLYDPRDGSRLATSTGADYLDLGIVTVTE
jgi:hypothetical protein